MLASRASGRSPRRVDVLLCFWLITPSASACSANDEDDRSRWLHHSIVLDNQPFLDRAPDLVEGKFALMADSLYAYMRGTATQFSEDLLLPGGAGRVPSAYLTPESRTVTIMSDPHPENLGTLSTGTSASQRPVPPRGRGSTRLTQRTAKWVR